MGPQHTHSAPPFVPFSPPPPPYTGQPNLPSGAGRSGGGWLWIAGAGCLAVLMCAAICFVTAALSIYRAVQWTPVYSHALARARSNPQVVSRLGMPIRARFLLKGNIRMNGGPGNVTGSADVMIPIHGPKGRATLHFVGSADRGRMNTKVLEVIFPDGTKIDLRTDQERRATQPDESVTTV